jgi:acetyltransferase-like isoleucine patch superfamily enzyme
MEVTFKKIGARLLKDPIDSFIAVQAFIRGICYSIYYRIFRKNVRIKLPFLAYYRVTIIGPGKVTLGRGCSVHKNAFKGLTIVTFSEAATVTIGERCGFGGLTIRCRNRVDIGEKTITATSLVQDFLFVNRDHGDDEKQISAPAPIIIGKNVWLSNDAIILGGSQIGDDSVVGAKSLCKDTKVAAYSLANGNPIKRGLPIENLLKLKGVR